MIPAVIVQLQTGRIKNVVPFGSSVRMDTPYVVVRAVTHPLAGRGVAVFTHMAPGQQVFLEAYARNDLSILLDGFRGVSLNGNRFILSVDDDFYAEIVTSNDDGTISLEKRFIVPARIF